MHIAAIVKRSADAVQGGKLVSVNFAAAKFEPQKNAAAIVSSTAIRGEVLIGYNTLGLWP